VKRQKEKNQKSVYGSIIGSEEKNLGDQISVVLGELVEGMWQGIVILRAETRTTPGISAVTSTLGEKTKKKKGKHGRSGPTSTQL